MKTKTQRFSWVFLGAALLVACGDDEASDPVDTLDTTPVADSAPAPDTTVADTVVPLTCVLADGAEVDSVAELGCPADFEALASLPLDVSIPGARSIKTVIDRFDENALYFMNSVKFPLHYDFASANLSGQGLPPVQDLNTFNQNEYTSPSRRFILGAITFYEEPGVWVYEIAPYDTASAEMITIAYDLIREAAWFGEELRFHPTSDNVEREAEKLTDSVDVISSEELFDGITFQPYNLATSTGKLRFVETSGLDEAILNFRDIVVLDAVPNDIAVVSGIITAELQTPLAHINVLSQNRGTPNMALVGALENETLRDLEGKWVELEVGAFEWSIKEITQQEADAWWTANKPPAVPAPTPDVTVTDLRDIADVLALDCVPGADFPESIAGPLSTAIPAFGGKASHYSAFSCMSDKVPVPEAFAIPLSHYMNHMQTHGLDDEVTAMLADATFTGDSVERARRLERLQADIIAAPIDPDFLDEVIAKMETDFPGMRMRFRSSTNAEDLDGFTGAGLYTSRSGDPNDEDRPVDVAIKTVWASIWNFKAFEERTFRSIDHTKVGMALLVHQSFPKEEANGVAVTGNLFDPSFLEPGFIINVQKGEASVVKPEPGITTDYFIYYYTYPNQPSVYLSNSNLVSQGQNVLTRAQTQVLGDALSEIHLFFDNTYQRPNEFYGMDVEFKFDGKPGEEPKLYIKQARPHPGWGL